jgi:rSAM/selenodomain-associated transferase 1
MMPSPYAILGPQQRHPGFAGRCALTVMAKVPRVGRVKTRLSPPLTAAQAAELNVAFLKDTLACLEQAAATTNSVPVISYTPVGEEDGFLGVVPSHVPLLPQRGDGFGERLRCTADDLFAAGFSAVCLIDSDSPTVPASAYAQAAQHLLRSEDCAVLGPSDDGGYYLLGINAPHPRLFEQITWSTELVAAETRQRAQQIALPLHELPIWFDVDDRRTLLRLRDELLLAPSHHGYPAPQTRATLLRVLDPIDAPPLNRLAPAAEGAVS